MVINRLGVNRCLVVFSLLFYTLFVKADNDFDFKEGQSFIDWVRTEFGNQKESEVVNQGVFGDFFIEKWSPGECDKRLAVALSAAFCRYQISDQRLRQKTVSIGEAVPVIGSGFNACYIPQTFTIDGISYSDFQREVTPFMFVYKILGSTRKLKYVAVMHKKMVSKVKDSEATSFAFVVYVNLNTGKVSLSTEPGRVMPSKLWFYRHPMLNNESLKMNQRLERREEKGLWDMAEENIGNKCQLPTDESIKKDDEDNNGIGP